MEFQWSSFAFFILYTVTNVVDVGSVKVRTAQGWLKGELLDAVKGGYQYYSFKGIPYAQPPLGTLRFKAPLPPLPWAGVRNAKYHGAKCPQVNLDTNEYIPGDEDCLFLNVYTPNPNPDTPLPVLFYIHGGSFKSDSGDIDYYGPDYLMDDGIILVTINYRFDALGFLCMNTEEVPGNAGLKDQVAALKWVHQNIGKFGGDPNSVTIMGQESGAASVGLHLVSPMSTGLFHRAVCASGVAYNDFAISYKPELRPFILGKQLGFDTQDPDELLQFLQSIPVNKLVNTFPSILTSEEYMRHDRFKMNIFTPVVEKKFGKDNFLIQTGEELIKNGFANEADLLIGHTGQERLYLIDDFVKSYLEIYDRYPEMLVPKKILVTSTPDKILEVSKMIHEYYFGDHPIDSRALREFVSYTNEAYSNYDLHSSLNILPKCDSCRTYFYIFTCESCINYYGKAGEKYGIRGPANKDDILYTFHANALNLTIDENAYLRIQLSTKLLANFVKCGNPTPDMETMGAIWPEYNNVTKLYLHGGDELAIGSHPDAATIEFWDMIYNYVGYSM